MHYLLQPFRVLWKVWFFLVFTCSLVLLYPFFLYALAKERRFYLAFRTMRFWAKLLSFFNGIWLEKEVRGDLPKPPYVICPNHSSYLDIIMMYRLFDDYFVFMGKSELNSWPLFNIFFTKGMNISVDRRSVVGAHNALERVKREIEKGHNVVIFPEGTIPHTVPVMKGFKNGAFKLAMEKNIPIVPVTFLTNWKRLQTGPALKRAGGPGASKVIVHPPVYPGKGNTPVEMITLREQVFQTVQGPLKEYYGNQ